MRRPSSPEFAAAAARVAAALMEEEIASEASVPAVASAVTEWEPSSSRHGDTGGGVPGIR